MPLGGEDIYIIQLFIFLVINYRPSRSFSFSKINILYHHHMVKKYNSVVATTFFRSNILQNSTPSNQSLVAEVTTIWRSQQSNAIQRNPSSGLKESLKHAIAGMSGLNALICNRSNCITCHRRSRYRQVRRVAETYLYNKVQSCHIPLSRRRRST